MRCAYGRNDPRVGVLRLDMMRFVDEERCDRSAIEPRVEPIRTKTLDQRDKHRRVGIGKLAADERCDRDAYDRSKRRGKLLDKLAAMRDDEHPTGTKKRLRDRGENDRLPGTRGHREICLWVLADLRQDRVNGELLVWA